MLRLFILRHAKSSWATSGMSDIQRPLNERGLRDLPKIAAVMARKNYLPDHVYCSGAKRTRMTHNGLFSELSSIPPTTFSDFLYSGGMQDYLNTLTAHRAADSLMIIGHNPTVHMLTDHLTEQGETALLDELAVKYPTGTLSVIDFEIDDWRNLTAGSGKLIDFFKPRALPD